MISCTFENGSNTSLRHITVNVIVIKDGRILMGKRGTYKGKPIIESGKWALIGGFFDRDETLVQAAKREVLEETGWKIDTVNLFRINDNPNRPKEDRQNVDMIFLAQATEKVGKPDEEVTETEWFSFDNLPPRDQIAFDHVDSIELYQKYLKEHMHLPL